MGVIYLDECGDEGLGIDGSDKGSEWFILGAVLHCNKDRDTLKDFYTSYREKRRRPDSWYFHFRNASHDERIGFIQHMRHEACAALSVIVHKPSLKSRTNLAKRYFLYFYAARILMERATWWADYFGETLTIKLSDRRGLTADAFATYLKHARNSPYTTRDLMKWNRLNLDTVSTSPNREFAGLQLADCVASAIGKALEFSEYSTTEPRYVKELNLMLVRFGGDLMAGGAKFFPALTPEIRAQERCQWLSEL